jgi:NAD(P)-dependent dehydrogenase (short-subunit alcohol dehydrogenase family)
MPREVSDSVIVITGASTGIGRASALAFARAGATVVVTSRREKVLCTLAESCKNLGGRAIAIAADVTDEPAIQDLARHVIERFGRIDVWINNAAVTLFARFEQTPPAAYRRVSSSCRRLSFIRFSQHLIVDGRTDVGTIDNPAVPNMLIID